jgi:NAD(P)-dependent dehydrogenase (short-subunit alcohol dehydrogenase family)
MAMHEFQGKVAVITGAASGFGLEFAKQGAALGMKLVLADIHAGALDAAVAQLRHDGADAIGVPTDVSQGEQVEALARAALDAYGRVHLLFNNAGVGAGGFIWESSAKDWEWVFGVNVMGVAHGVRVFTPILLRQDEPAHIVNTASVAGLLSPPAMAIYNASKHAVVALTETLYNDLRLAGTQVGCSLLCPAFVPTGIACSERNRPAHLCNDDVPLTDSQLAAAKQIQKAVESGKISAAQVAQITFDAIRARRFYILTHPNILSTVELRLRDILAQRNPTDPFSLKPAVRPAKSPA